MKPLPKKFTGDHPIVPALNRMLENLTERTPQSSHECGIDTLPIGFKIKPPSIPDIAGGLVEQFLFIRQYKDYIVCKRWVANLLSDARGIIGAAEDQEVRIAKPFEIRTSFWDYIARGGAAIGRVNGHLYAHAEPDGHLRTDTLIDASDFGAGSITSDQEIFPPYIENHTLITAQQVMQGPLMTVTETVNGTPQTFTIDYEELPGRVFVNVERKIRVCIEGQSGAWFALFRPSGAFREE